MWLQLQNHKLCTITQTRFQVHIAKQHHHCTRFRVRVCNGRPIAARVFKFRRFMLWLTYQQKHNSQIQKTYLKHHCSHHHMLGTHLQYCKAVVTKSTSVPRCSHYPKQQVSSRLRDSLISSKKKKTRHDFYGCECPGGRKRKGGLQVV